MTISRFVTCSLTWFHIWFHIWFHTKYVPEVMFGISWQEQNTDDYGFSLGHISGSSLQSQKCASNVDNNWMILSGWLSPPGSLYYSTCILKKVYQRWYLERLFTRFSHGPIPGIPGSLLYSPKKSLWQVANAETASKQYVSSWLYPSCHLVPYLPIPKVYQRWYSFTWSCSHISGSLPQSQKRASKEVLERTYDR